MELHGKNFIGDRLAGGSGETLVAISPLDGMALPGTFGVAGPEEVAAALTLADAASAGFGNTTGEQRARLLERIAAEVEAAGDELIRRAHVETGLPEARLAGERVRTTGQLKLFAGVAREGSWVDARIDPALPDRRPLPRPDLRRFLRPIGPVVVFGASNFPLAFSVAGGDTASALATGNPVVVKAHERHPGTSEIVAAAIRRAVVGEGLPSGVFSMLHGPGRAIGPALVQHPLVRAVSFTGSRAAGRALFDAAAARSEPIPVFAEMSSLNPVFLLPNALRERAPSIAAGLGASVTLGVGQFCTKPGLVFAPKSPELTRFTSELAERLRAVGPGTMLHEGIAASYHRGVERAGAVPGAAPLVAAARSDSRTSAGPALFEIDVPTFLGRPEVAEEVFGPFAWIVTGTSVRDLERAAGILEGQLTATVHGTSEDLESAAPLLRILERKAGRIIINGFPTGVEVSPAMHHGGPYPATTDARFTSVGTAALLRFVRPMCYQDCPAALLPAALQDKNPLGIRRLVNGELTRDPLGG